MSRPRVTFVSHDASRTGAPLLLLEFVRWLREGRWVDPTIVCLRGGPLEGAFAALAPTSVVAAPGSKRKPTDVIVAGLDEAGAHRAAGRIEHTRIRRALDAAGPADLLWLSAAPSLSVVAALDGRADPVPIVAHVHELSSVLAVSLPPDELARGLAACARVVVGAQPVADAVVAAGALPGAVRVCDEFVAVPAAPRRDAAADLRAELGIPAGAPVVGAIGTATWRKGLDLFVLLARMLRDRPATSDAHFVWIGGHPTDVLLDEARFDVAQAGLSDRVHLVGEQVELDPWYALFDLFVLTSREDSFPLVCVHAAARSIPVVAFDSGIGDLLRRAGDPDSAIRDLDPVALADRVAELVARPALRASIGTRLTAEVRRRHVTGAAAPRLFGVLEQATRAAG